MLPYAIVYVRITRAVASAISHGHLGSGTIDLCVHSERHAQHNARCLPLINKKRFEVK